MVKVKNLMNLWPKSSEKILKKEELLRFKMILSLAVKIRWKH